MLAKQKLTQSLSYLKNPFRDWSKGIGKGGGEVGQSREGVGRSIFSYPWGWVILFFFMGIDTHLTLSATKVTPFKVVAAMDSCFSLIRPHQHGTANRHK